MKNCKRLLSVVALACGLSLALAFCIVTSSKAQQVISYQGLGMNNGTPLSGTHAVTLAIYKSAAGGVAIHSETQSTVAFTTDGIFNVLIGTDPKNPLPIFDAGSYNGAPRTAPDYFLGIAIDGGAELTPRSQLGASPTAWSSQFADSARVAGNGVTGSGASNKVPVWTAPPLNGTMVLGNSSIDDNGTTVVTAENIMAGAYQIFNIHYPNSTVLATNIGTGTDNIFVGYGAGPSNTTGSGNSFVGIDAGYSNTSGTGNTYLGKYAGYLDTSGNANTIVGFYAGQVNASSGNTFIGNDAGQANTSGGGNTFLGDDAGFSNRTGSSNTFTGWAAGDSNTSGSSNAFAGNEAGEFNTIGSDNTFTGYQAGQGNTTGGYNTVMGAEAGEFMQGQDNTFLGYNAGITNGGSDNTFVGYSATADNFSGSNATAIGSRAVAVVSNSVVIGNSSVTSIGGSVGWSTLSDGRFKKNVQGNVPGLAFISLLTPVTYNLDVRGLNRHIGAATSVMDEAGIQNKESIVYSGFVAQDVETAANTIGYNFDGVGKPQNDKDHYTLAYASFVPSLVKSVQELNAMIASQQALINQLQSEVEQLKSKSK